MNRKEYRWHYLSNRLVTRGGFLLALLGLMMLASSVARAETPKTNNKWKKIWRVSQVVLAASHAADTHSSWGRPELNPVLRNRQGTFGAKGLSLKLGITGAFLLAQEKFSRSDRHKSFAVVNFASAAVLTGVGVHSSRLPSKINGALIGGVVCRILQPESNYLKGKWPNKNCGSMP